jgi:serine/threonine protein phosphatase 1
LDKYEMIFVGHNPTVSSGSGTPIQCFNLINLDTGAGYMGYVTVMDVDTMQYWQSDSALAIYGKT